MKVITAVLITISAISSKVFSQPYPKKDILKKMKAKDLVWGEYYGEDVVLAKMKSTKKWGLYSVYQGMDIDDFSFEEFVPPLFDSLNFFQLEDRFQIVKQKDKYGILLHPDEVPVTPYQVKCKHEKLIHKKVDGEDYVLFQKDEKWGLIDWFDQFVIVDPIFETPDEVPLIHIERSMMDIYRTAKKSLEADLIIFDPNNGDGGLKARHKETKKWGMYQFIGDEQKELIPMHYDSLNFYPFNGKYTTVYSKGKVGVYLSYWSYDEESKQTVECKYDDYKRYNADGVSKLAMNKNGKWGWVDWLTGEEKSEFKYESPDDLPYPHYKQNYWFDD